MDTSKLDQDPPYTFAEISEIDTIITDKPLPDDIERCAEDSNIEIILA